MKKELLKFLCTSLFALVCLSVNATIYHGYCGNEDDLNGDELEDVEWFFNDATGNLTIKIVKYSGNKSIKEYSTEDPTGYPWYTHANNIKSIIIGEGITNVPAWAFAMMEHCTSVSLPSTLTSIGNCALEECAFTSINLPEGLTTIGDYAFQMGALTSVTIPSTVTNIGTVAFQDNESLTTVTCLAAEAPTLGDNVFSNCNNLTKIYKPAASDYTGSNWGDYSELFDDLAATTTTFTYTAAEKVNEFETSIGRFLGATSIKSHEFVDGTGTVIYNGAVTSITDYALSGTTITSLTIPDGVVWIAEGAVAGCDYLTSVSIPNSVTHIGTEAFEFTPIASLSFPSSVKFIADMAFECAPLTSISIPSGVTAICADVFNGCNALESITIPDGIVEIGEGAFAGCDAVENVYCYAAPTLIWGAPENDFANTTNFHVSTAIDTWETNFATALVNFVNDLADVKVTPVEDDYWATFYDATTSYAVDANTTVYKASLSGTTVTITAIGGNQIITHDNAVILKSTGIPVLTTTATASTGDFDGNSLLGSDGVASDGNSYYALANGSQGLGFYKVGNGTVIPAGKAYLYTGGAGSNFYGIDPGDGTTAIKNMKVGKNDNFYYDLSGHRVLYPKKGLYIMNGKKVIIK